MVNSEFGLLPVTITARLGGAFVLAGFRGWNDSSGSGQASLYVYTLVSLRYLGRKKAI